MRGLCSFFLSTLMALLPVSPLSARDRTPPPRRVPQANVPFDLYRSYLIVARGSAGPLKGLNFLLDTGASPSLVDRRLAQRLHLQDRPAGLAVLDGRVKAASTVLPTLTFGPIERNNLPVLVEDLSFLEEALQRPIDAVVGLDVLGQSSFTVDYSARQIRFGPPPTMPISIPLSMEDGLPFIDAELNGAPAHLLVDTGASSLILFETRLPGLINGLKVSAIHRSANLLGDFDRKQVSLDRLKLGGLELAQQPASVVRNRDDAGLHFDGLVSPAALGLRIVAIDRERGLLAFSR
jgi:predicted aspartyl protease